MPGVQIFVSIAEVLEVRGGPLQEAAVWALLCQSAAAIQDFFIKGASRQMEDTIFAISPTTLMVGRDGEVMLTPGNSSWHGTDFRAPEILSDIAQHGMSDTAIEKMFLFTLGKTLQVATEYGLRHSEYVNIGEHLDSLLEAMCEPDPAVRIGLRPVFEACSLHLQQHQDKAPYAHTLSRLYLSVMSPIDEPFHISSGSTSTQSTLTLRSRRRPRHPNFIRHGSISPRSPSPTHRSRSRSCSLSDSRGDSRPVTKSMDIEENDGLSTFPSETVLPTQDSVETPAATSASSSSSQAAPTFITAVATDHTEGVSSIAEEGPASSSHLDVSFTSSEAGSLHRPGRAYRSANPLLGLRMGSPAYEKYLRLKERQRRLRVAKTGVNEQAGATAVLQNGMSATNLVVPHGSLWRGDLMDYVTDSRSLASLMSYNLGNYVPDMQHLDSPGAAPASSLGRADDLDRDADSLLSSELSFLVRDGLPPHHPHHQNHPNNVPPSEESWTTPDHQTSLLKRLRDEEPIHPHQQHEQQYASVQQSVRQQQQQQPALQQTEMVLEQLHQFGSRDLTPASSTHPSREYYGPEFIFRASRPVVRIPLPLCGESLKNPALARRVAIVHLNGQKYEAIVDPCMTGRQLFDAVITQTNLDDFFFFGLTYVLEGEHYFLDADTKLHKMAPEGWREGSKGHMPPVTFTLYLRIKFYPDSLAEFRHSGTQHLLYLQLRRDILEERCLATDQQLLSLAGLALHAEFGDYSHRTMAPNYFVPEQYLPHRVSRRLGMGYVHDRALEAHRDALGLAPSQCEIQFIKIVQTLPEYGIHFYKLMRTKNDTDDVVWLGLTQASLLIAEQSGPSRCIVRSLSWPSIMKISFNKRRFSVQPKVDLAANSKGKPPKLNFFTTSYRKGRYLLQLSTAQHRFHIRMRTRAAALESMGVAGEMLVGNEGDQQSAIFLPMIQELHGPEHLRDSGEQGTAEVQMVVKGDQAVASVDSSPTRLSNKLSGMSGETTSEDAEERLAAPPLKYRSPPPYKPNLDFFTEEMASNAGLVADWLSESHDANLHALNSKESQEMHAVNELVVNGVTQQEQELAPSQQHTSHPLPHHSYHHLSPTHPPPEYHSYLSYQPFGHSSLGRRIFEVTLTKDEEKGIGLTIVGGEATSSLDLGIFVKSVIKDGPAAKVGGIQPGDRLIAINGISLEGVQHQEAVQLIRDFGPSITLLISQMRPPTTIKRKVSSLAIGYDIDDDDGVCHSDEEVSEEIYATGLMHVDSIPEILQQNSVASSLFQFASCHGPSSTNILQPPDVLNVNQSQMCLPLLSADYFFNGNSESKFPPDQFYHHPKNIRNVSSLSSSSSSSSSSPLHYHNNHHLDKTDQEKTVVKSVGPNNTMTVTSNLHNVFSHLRNLTVREFDASDLKPDGKVERLQTALESQAQSYESYNVHQAWQDGDHTSVESMTEVQELQILEEIASMTMDSSDTDSDFDSAIQASVGGQVKQSESGTSAFDRYSKSRKVFSASPDAVIYEVLLEKQLGSLGIVLTEGQAENEDSRISIRSLVSGGPAERGGILHPDDLLLEVNSHSLRGATVADVERVIKASPDLCLLKIVRTRSLDELDKRQEQAYANCLGVLASLQQSLRDITTPDSITAELATAGDTLTTASTSPISPPSAFASGAPTPVRWPSLPAALDPAKVNRLHSNSTQIDVTSDVLDGSRSELGDMPVTVGEDIRESNKLESNHAVLFSYALDVLQGDTLTDPIAPSDETCVDSLHKDSSTKTFSFDTKTVDSRIHQRALVKQPRVIESPQKLIENDIDIELTSGTVQSDTGQYCEFTVDLLKSTSGGLGFTVVGGISTTGGCYVKAVVQDPALSDGRLQPGDRLLQVNGHDMTGLSHFEAVTFLRQTPREVSIKVRRYVSLELDFLYPTQDKNNRNMHKGPPNQHFHYQGAIRRKECHNKTQNHGDDPGEKCQESVEGLQQHCPIEGMQQALEPQQLPQSLVQAQAMPCAIIRPYKHQPAADQDRSYVQSVQKDEENGFTETTKPAQQDKIKQSGVPADRLHVVLRKQSVLESLGFSVMQQRLGGEQVIIVKTLTPSGIAEKDGQLQVGDQLLQINGVSLIGCSHTTAVRLLREVADTAALTVCRTIDNQLIYKHTEHLLGANGEIDPDRTPSVSSRCSDIADNEINDILDAALNCLDKEGDSSQDNLSIVTNTDSRGESDSYSSNKPTPKPRGRGGQSNKDRPQEEDGCCYVRKFGHEETLAAETELSAEWLLSLPLVVLRPAELEARSSSFLQQLTEAVEEGRPLEEFQTLQQLKATDNSEMAKLPQNRARNRYRNVLPYDCNRVRLKVADEEDNDYINASHVRLPVQAGTQELHYVACQGPLPPTFTHFWQMVWENRVNVIIMLTQEMEVGKVKCHHYYPSAPEELFELDTGTYSVQMVREERFQDFVVRHLSLRQASSGEQRQIVQLHYTAWPDHGVPDTAYPLLCFLRLLHLYHCSGPLLVHCSAGIGRTGVLMTIDTALAKIENDDHLDIFEIVSELRYQRYGMIQTQDQYLFCYTALMEALLRTES